MFEAINTMMLDVLSAVARMDYDDCRRRQARHAKVKAEGRYTACPEDVKRNTGIAAILAEGISWSQVQVAAGCSRARIAKIAKPTA